MQNLPKHHKYKSRYKPNEVYWGLGVEHETYLETSKLKRVTLTDLKEKRARERYSVDYLTVYNKESLDKALEGLFTDPHSGFTIPILMNAHSFQKTDIQGEHKTTYERVPKPNPKFSGQTIFEWMQKENPDVFKEDYEASFLFDGDTIEFVTQDFYKATVSDVMHELIKTEKDFLRALNSLPREGIIKTYAPFKIAEKNYGFASYLTNLKNNALFNNGTLHINITLPTKLNEKGEIEDFEAFKEKHANYAKAIQWLSPLIVAKYGAYDPLCESKTNGDLFAAGSQRVAVSRYIGLGTYDTDTMEVGKILTKPRECLKDIEWYESFHQKAGYKLLNELGMDINFNKHYAHGIEFRILESLPYSDLESIMQTLVHLADFSLIHNMSNPKKSPLWHSIAEKCVYDGMGYFMDVSDQNELYNIFKIHYCSKEPRPASDVYDIITEHLELEYSEALCTKAMIYGEEYAIPQIFKEENTPEQSPPASSYLSSPFTPLTSSELNSLLKKNVSFFVDRKPHLDTILELDSPTTPTPPPSNECLEQQQEQGKQEEHQQQQEQQEQEEQDNKQEDTIESAEKVASVIASVTAITTSGLTLKSPSDTENVVLNISQVSVNTTEDVAEIIAEPKAPEELKEVKEGFKSAEGELKAELQAKQGDLKETVELVSNSKKKWKCC